MAFLKIVDTDAETQSPITIRDLRPGDIFRFNDADFPTSGRYKTTQKDVYIRLADADDGHPFASLHNGLSWSGAYFSGHTVETLFATLTIDGVESRMIRVDKR